MANTESLSLEILNNTRGVKTFDVLRIFRSNSRHISAMGQRSPKNEPRKMLVKMCRKLCRDERRIVKRILQIEREINVFETEAAAGRQSAESLPDKIE